MSLEKSSNEEDGVTKDDIPTEPLKAFWISCSSCGQQGTITKPVGDVPDKCPSCDYKGIFLRAT